MVNLRSRAHEARKTGVYKTRTGSDRIGSDRIDKTRTGSDRINKPWIGLRPIDKTRTGSENNRIAINFPPKSHVIPHSVNTKPHGSYRLPSLEMN